MLRKLFGKCNNVIFVFVVIKKKNLFPLEMDKKNLCQCEYKCGRVDELLGLVCLSLHFWHRFVNLSIGWSHLCIILCQCQLEFYFIFSFFTLLPCKLPETVQFVSIGSSCMISMIMFYKERETKIQASQIRHQLRLILSILGQAVCYIGLFPTWNKWNDQWSKSH